VAGIVTMKIS